MTATGRFPAWPGLVLALVLALLLARPGPLVAQEPGAGVTVVLVRHGEKVDDSRDAALSAAGLRRAESLAEVLADAGVTAIYTTQFQRTANTARPLAERSGVEAQVIASTPGEDHAAAVAARVRLHTAGTVVVVGHSNTVPAIISALGGPAVSIGDDEYHHLFLLRLGVGVPQLIRARY
jgi:broad specificity phosphatase PhoE